MRETAQLCHAGCLDMGSGGRHAGRQIAQLQVLLCLFAQQGNTLQEGQLLLLLLLHACPEGLLQPHLQAGRRNQAC